MAEARLGRVVLGTVALGMAYGIAGAPAPTDAGAVDVLRRARALGIAAFDTAPAYGASERRLGLALDQSATVWTKLDAGVATAADPAGAAIASLDASLAALRRDTVDLLQWHNWRRELLGDAAFEAAWRALAGDRRVLALGASTYGADDALAAVASGRFAVVQVEWSLLDQSVLRALGSRARAAGVRIAVRSVLLQGVLTDAADPLPARLAHLTAPRARAAAVAARCGLPLEDLALGAALRHPDIDWVLAGVDRAEQLDPIVRAARDGDRWPADAELAALHVGPPATDPRTWAPA